MKYYLGIDPGKKGAFSIINENSQIVELVGMPLIGKEYDKKEIITILEKYQYHKIGLEKPSVIFGIGKSAVASLMQCVGMLEGMMLGLNLPYVLTPPKQWQKECWKHVKIQKKQGTKKNDTKATSILSAVNLFPNADFKITNNGNKSKNYNDGMIDASLVAEYVRRVFR